MRTTVLDFSLVGPSIATIQDCFLDVHHDLAQFAFWDWLICQCKPIQLRPATHRLVSPLHMNRFRSLVEHCHISHVRLAAASTPIYGWRSRCHHELLIVWSVQCWFISRDFLRVNHPTQVLILIFISHLDFEIFLGIDGWSKFRARNNDTGWRRTWWTFFADCPAQ